MNSNDNLIIVKLSEEGKYKEEAVRVFVDSFYNQYKGISKDKSLLVKLFLASFDFNLTYGAIKDGQALGFLAISNAKERSMKFDKSSFVKLLGKVKGPIIYHELMFISGKPNLEDAKGIGIDYLATSKAHRGQGIATNLIEHAYNELRESEFYIEVAATNTTAKRLYEHLKFKEYKQEHTIINRLMGFGYVIKMKRELSL